jgi:hypothetical protein
MYGQEFEGKGMLVSRGRENDFIANTHLSL